ncbi:MAG: hypothetical protein L3J39_13925 [Verrucomicrobiales bacterium]|nr:hypothetical protein [Verrucomicrobiales bacterium]
MSTKEKAIETIRKLPDDVDWPDIENKIHFMSAIERGRQDIREGKITPIKKSLEHLQDGLLNRLVTLEIVEDTESPRG